ncbi:MAG: roadblock/LC7 domain-containing protein [Deltaproteobacteria bacterium]|nr:roadblock/LC7 domain-containing protein [Deltaproteobacteria bacterium]MBW1870703.1 roadblock/LC7 domain-containing protein [Deltaproteobacteria bacterium]
MSFQEELESICQHVPGCQSVVVMNLDGIVVGRQDNAESELDIEILLVELTSSLKQALQALVSIQGGEMAEFSILFDKGSLVIRLLEDEHFVAVLLQPEALVGRGRYALRRHAQPLVKELF